jgi:site-specific DNA-cytosine methylase
VFSFVGSDNDAYRMIGNGVSVPVGRWIATEIKRYFGKYPQISPISQITNTHH